jgi:DNA-binding CsgD family transcriptional regulator
MPCYTKVMSHNDKRVGSSRLSKWIEHGSSGDNEFGILRLAAAEPWPGDDGVVVRQLNGPLTALLIYIGEIKKHSHQFAEAGGNRAYLQQVVENALQQTERICALVRQIANPQDSPFATPQRGAALAGRAKSAVDASAMLASDPGRKPLTKREREVLGLISEGHSNKQGALRMGISPRTFESHRAEAMRKLGARNTADLVRKALSHRSAV